MNTLAFAVATVCTGLSAGVYLAFSTMVMPALARAPSAQSLTLMRFVNDRAERPTFLAVFFGAAAGSAWVLVAGWLPAGNGEFRTTLAAALSLAAFAVTVAFHVPRNRRIGRLDQESTGDLLTWQTLSTQWRRGNHLRAACAGLAFVGYLG